MDINALGVMNVMHKLGITEEEFKAIGNETKNKSPTGLYIHTIKNGYVIGVNHDRHHQVFIKKAVNVDFSLPCRVLLKIHIPMLDLPKEIYVLHGIVEYHSLDTEVRYKIHNLEQLKERIMDRFVDKYPKKLGKGFFELYRYDEEREKILNQKADHINEQLKAIFWLFNENYESFQEIVTRARPNIPKIVKAFQHNNRRLAIFQECQEFKQGHGNFFGHCSWYEDIKRTELSICVYTPKDPRYNYVSTNREVFFSGYGESEIWLDDDMQDKVSEQELRVLSKRGTAEQLTYTDEDGGRDDLKWFFLSLENYNEKRQAVMIEIMNEKRKQDIDEAERKLKNKQYEDFKKKGKLVKSGIELTTKGMEYEGVTFQGTRFGKYLIEENILYGQDIDFSGIAEKYILWILKLRTIYHNDGNTKFVPCLAEKDIIRFNKVKCAIELRKNTYYINDYRVNKADLKSLALTVLNCADQEEYDALLEMASKLSITLQMILDNGAFWFQLRSGTTSEDSDLPKLVGDLHISIPLSYEKNKLFAVIDGNKYKIRDRGALLSLAEDVEIKYGWYGSEIERTIKLLCRAIGDIPYDVVAKIIEKGIPEYKRLMARKKAKERAELKKSTEILNNAVRLSKAVKIHGGYKVVGDSGTIYTININTLSVNKVINGKSHYLCIIGDDRGDKYTRVASRLLMLAHDKKVAGEIYDRGDHMDVHWHMIRTDARENVNTIEEEAEEAEAEE